MKSIWMVLVLGVCLVSCGSDPVSRPFVAQTAKKKAASSKKQKGPPKTKEPIEKAFAGKVTFEGLTSAQLDHLRVIPEEGVILEIPGIGTYPQVDGFWFRGEPDEWFKIPDHSEVWVGNAPNTYDGTAHRGGLTIYYRRSALLGVVGAIRGRLKHPKWVPDGGLTKCPIPSPFKSES